MSVLPSPTPRFDRVQRSVVTGLAVLSAALLAYIAHLCFARTFSYSVVANGWLPDGFEIVVSLLCIGRGFAVRRGRAVAWLLGAGLLSWALGDLIWTVQSIDGSSQLTDALGAATWLGFYPLAYAAIIFLMRREVAALTTSSWIDGAIAGLGTAAICSAFAFHGIGYSDGKDALADVTNFAYPVGDVMLLALIVVGTVIVARAGTATWTLLALGCALNCVGDTLNLFQSTEGAARLDALFHILAWPSAGLVMTLALWLSPPIAHRAEGRRPSRLLLPGMATGAGLVIVTIEAVHPVGRIALGLAVATLLAAGARMVWSARGLQALTEHHHRRSLTDELTGLGNRRQLFDLLDAFFEDQLDDDVRRHQLAVLFIDLDHFKELNDSFGHMAGDELLRQLGPRLSRCLRRDDVLVRFGGDEFAAVLFDAGRDRATGVAQHLASSLREAFVLDGVKATVGASIGIAMVPLDARSTDAVLRCADTAMYRAKSSQRPYVFYEQVRDDDENPWQLGEELRHAIEQRQLVLHYQAQLDLAAGEVTGVEALVRWCHPTRGILPPLKFLPLAEQAELMPQLTALLLDDALAQCARWRSEGRMLTMSVNISASNLLEHGFVELVDRLLTAHGVPPTALVLEITETSVIANFEESRVVIESLRARGVGVSIDDFGAGFTALSFLSRLAVNELKLDRKFVTGLPGPGRDRDRELVRSTIELGHALSMRVIAEGVEDEETLDVLVELGADLAQGFHIGRPVPPEEFWLHRHVAA